MKDAVTLFVKGTFGMVPMKGIRDYLDTTVRGIVGVTAGISVDWLGNYDTAVARIGATIGALAAVLTCVSLILKIRNQLKDR